MGDQLEQVTTNIKNLLRMDSSLGDDLPADILRQMKQDKNIDALHNWAQEKQERRDLHAVLDAFRRAGPARNLSLESRLDSPASSYSGDSGSYSSGSSRSSYRD